MAQLAPTPGSRCFPKHMEGDGICRTSRLKRIDAGSHTWGQTRRGRPVSVRPGGDQQCLIRDANEAIERLNVRRAATDRLELRCECGDPACLARVRPTHAEYEAVRASGSRFLFDSTTRTPRPPRCVSENERFAVIDVVAAPPLPGAGTTTRHWSTRLPATPCGRGLRKGAAR